jgi:hypothetical protein
VHLAHRSDRAGFHPLADQTRRFVRVPWFPICVATLYCRAAWASARASPMVRASGFWMNVCFELHLEARSGV